MVAYSYQPMFVAPIKRGLVSAYPDERGLRPKRQTIRARGRRRHARPGEELQLYCRQRSKDGFLIGRARCVGVDEVHIAFRKARRGARDWVKINGGRPGDGDIFDGVTRLNEFARRDGFETWGHLIEFWLKHHPGVDDFDGLLIRWEPL